MKAHVLKHTACAPSDITVLPPANHSTCAKAHRVSQPYNEQPVLVFTYYFGKLGYT